ncbi:hypothetical protein HGQ85_18535 [Clostridioides difficile]|nr:hypothetical protein [Clostridioides difficile]
MTTSNFVQQINSYFFDNTNLNYVMPYYKNLEITEDGTKNFKMTLKDKGMTFLDLSSKDSFRDIVIYTSNIFLSFDEYINYNNPDIAELNFKNKYIRLTSNSDIDIITKEVYRILKLMRNTIIHNLSNLSQIEDDNNIMINFSYSFKNTNFNLNLSQENLFRLYAMVILITREFSVYESENKEFYIGILRLFYDKLKNDICNFGEFQDDIDDMGLMEISNDIRLERIRLCIEKPIYEKSEKIKIQRVCVKGEKESSPDYPISIDGIEYIIPDEVLDAEGKLELSELIKWRVNN